LHEQHPDFLPNQSKILKIIYLSFLFSKQIFKIDYASHLLKCDLLWSIKEYLDYYEKPFNVVLESGIDNEKLKKKKKDKKN
jgi:hypothetical protein